jgi:hypothetical protein
MKHKGIGSMQAGNDQAGKSRPKQKKRPVVLKQAMRLKFIMATGHVFVFV